MSVYTLLRSPVSDRFLRKSHGVAFFVQLASAIAIGATLSDFSSAPVFVHFPVVNTSDTSRRASEQRELGKVEIAYFSVVFLALSALQHFLIAAPLWDVYLGWVREGRNPLRWLEYAFSASVMHVHVSFLCGIYDVHMLFLVGSLTATTMLFGLIGEKAKDITVFWAGFVPYITGWSVTACFFFYSISKTSGVPDFVWAIFFIITTLDLSFALLMAFGLYRVWRFGEFRITELGYVLLSFTSKQFLAWMNFYGSSERK